MKQNIAILTGGNSSEYVISVQSAESIAKELDPAKYKAFTIEIKNDLWFYKTPEGEKIPIDKNDFSLSPGKEKILFDCVFIAIHGTPGEDGKLQGYFDLLNIPYTTSSLDTSALTFNKFFCNHFVHDFEVKMAKSVLLRKSEAFSPQRIVGQVGLPCFVKPNKAGSSFGITKVKAPEHLTEAIEIAFKEDDEVLVEEFISGTEITCGLFKSASQTLIFPLTEIVSKTEFFDFSAKYTPELVEEIVPARVSEEVEKQCKALSERLYDWLNCRGIVRIDYILNNSGLYFLEVNTIPGLTFASIVPKMVRAMGFKLSDLYDLVIQDAIARK